MQRTGSSFEGRNEILLTAFTVVAVVSAVIAVLLTLQWPMVGDARLIRYAGFLMSRGFVPYRDFAEINLPGSLAIDWIASHLFGSGSLAWRLFDLLLTLSSGLAILLTVGRQEWRSATVAASLYAIAHWGDGIAQLGQRDFQIALLLLGGVAAWLALSHARPAAGAFAFGVLHGVAFLSKPNSLLLTACCLLALLFVFRREGKPALPFFLIAGAGFLIPCLAAATFLVSHGALRPFWFTLHVLLPYHASLARRPLLYLLVHCLAPYAVLVYLWLAVSLISDRSPRFSPTRLLLLAGLVGGLAMYIVQGKGFPYHRYPFLVFALPLIATDCVRWIRSGHGAKRASAAVALAAAVLIVCPLSLARVRRFDTSDRLSAGLTEDLASFPGLDRQVQCLDSVQGCIAVLESLHLVQTTGLIYDEFLFGDPTSAAVQTSRARFSHDLQAHPPRVIVLVDGFFLDGSTGYHKLAAWPAFTIWLNSHYRIAVDRPSPGLVRWWGRAQPAPGYRLYVLREAPSVPPLGPR